MACRGRRDDTRAHTGVATQACGVSCGCGVLPGVRNCAGVLLLVSSAAHVTTGLYCSAYQRVAHWAWRS